MRPTTALPTPASGVVQGFLAGSPLENLVYVKEPQVYCAFETNFIPGQVYSEAQIIQEQVESGTRLTVLAVILSARTNLNDITCPYLTRIDLATRNKFIFAKSGETVDIGKFGAQEYVELLECDPILQDARFKTPTEIYVFFEDVDCLLRSGDPVFSFKGRFYLSPVFGCEYESDKESDYRSGSNGIPLDNTDTNSDSHASGSDEVETSDTSAGPHRGSDDEEKNTVGIAANTSPSSTSGFLSSLNGGASSTNVEPVSSNHDSYDSNNDNSGFDGQPSAEADHDLDLPIFVFESADQIPFVYAGFDDRRVDDTDLVAALQGLSVEAIQAHSDALEVNRDVMFW